MIATVQSPRYFRMALIGIASFLAGNQLAHSYFQPLKDLPEMIEKEMEIIKENNNYRVKHMEDEIRGYYQFDNANKLPE